MHELKLVCDSAEQEQVTTDEERIELAEAAELMTGEPERGEPEVDSDMSLWSAGSQSCCCWVSFCSVAWLVGISVTGACNGCDGEGCCCGTLISDEPCKQSALIAAPPLLHLATSAPFGLPQ